MPKEGRVSGASVRIADFFARTAGAQPGLLRHAPRDLARYVSIGSMIASVATLASISAFIALQALAEINTLPAVVVSLLWGILVLGIERTLVVTSTRRRSAKSTTLWAIPKLALGVVLGVSISVPLVLQIFNSEIESEVQISRLEAVQENRAQLGSEYDRRMSTLEEEESRLQSIVAGSAPVQVDDDPEVSRLRRQVEAAQSSLDDAESNVICELDGTCGSGSKGIGPAYREKVDLRDRRRSELQTLQRDLASAEAAAKQRIAANGQQRQEAAAADLARVRDQLASLRAEQDDALASSVGAEDANGRIIERLSALGRISQDQPVAGLAAWSLVLLFGSVALLPIGAKLASDLGPQSTYERLVRSVEEDALDTALRRQDAQHQLAIFEDQLQLQTQRDLIMKRAEVAAELPPSMLSPGRETLFASSPSVEPVRRWSPIGAATAGSLSILGSILGLVLNPGSFDALYVVPLTLGAASIFGSYIISDLRSRYLARMHRRLEAARIEFALRRPHRDELAVLADDRETLRRTGDNALCAQFAELIEAATK